MFEQFVSFKFMSIRIKIYKLMLILIFNKKFYLFIFCGEVQNASKFYTAVESFL